MNVKSAEGGFIEAESVVEWQARQGAAVESEIRQGQIVLTPQPLPEHPMRFRIESTFQFFGSGEIRIAQRILPTGPSTILPRMGVALTLPESYNSVRYYGRGPWENSPDRKTAAHPAVYQDTAAAMFTPYAKPQDCGNREEVRWMEIVNPAGRGLRLSGRTPFSASVLPHTQMELVMAAHQHELPPPQKTIVHLDAKQLGVGGASCGPPPMERDWVRTDPVEFAFSIVVLTGS